MQLPETVSLWVPNDDTDLTPLQGVFNSSASSVSSAIRLLRGDGVTAVTNDTVRNRMFPTPTQGQRVFNEAKMYEETYYATRTAGNRLGANTAGWYPSPYGAFSSLHIRNKNRDTSVSYTSAGVAALAWSYRNDPLNWNPGPDLRYIAPKIPGEYRLTASVQFERPGTNVVGWRAIEIRDENGIGLQTQVIEVYPIGAAIGASVSTTVICDGNKNTYQALIYQNSGVTLKVDVDFSAEFITPQRSN